MKRKRIMSMSARRLRSMISGAIRSGRSRMSRRRRSRRGRGRSTGKNNMLLIAVAVIAGWFLLGKKK